MGPGYAEDQRRTRRVAVAETMDTDGSSRSCGGDSASPGGRGSSVQQLPASVEVLDPDGHLRADISWLTDAARRAADALNARGEVRVRLVGDDEMADAHQKYSNIPGTTDVLTFDMRESADGPLDVDVLVCVDEARRQAAANAVTPREEALLYIVHAMLHCLGYDDHDEADSARMHQREDEILEAIGVGRVFGKGAA